VAIEIVMQKMNRCAGQGEHLRGSGLGKEKREGVNHLGVCPCAGVQD
jgi:hypothetical protein